MSKATLNTLQTAAIQHTNGTSGLVISSGGIPTRPNIPAFYAYSTASAYDTATGVFTTKLNTTLVNNGNYYNTTNGRFTVPITGIYQFQIKLLGAWLSSAGYVETTLYRNGVNIAARSFGFTYIVSATDHDTITSLAYISLNANDYIQMGVTTVTAGTQYFYGDNLTSFCGHLVG
jgi:hypothetical protein